MDDLVSELKRNHQLFRKGRGIPKHFDDENDDGTDRHGWTREKPVRRKPPHKIEFGGGSYGS